MWGIIPAAGRGTRIQPLAFSKELLPVSACGGTAGAQPRAVSDYLIERLVCGGAERLCFVISPRKSDILEYYGGSAHAASICYAVQPEPNGLCDAIFRAIPFIDPSAPVLIGLPDTIWFPADALCGLPAGKFSFLLFSGRPAGALRCGHHRRRRARARSRSQEAGASIELDLGRDENARIHSAGAVPSVAAA